MRPWPAVRRFFEVLAARAPTLRIDFHGDLGQALLTAIRRGRIDVALVLGPVADPSLASIVLSREPLVVALPVRHRLAALSWIPATELRSVPLVLFPRELHPDLYDYYLETLHRYGVRSRVIQEPMPEGSRAGVGAGMGFTLVPGPLAAQPMAGVVHRPLAELTPGVGVNLILAKENDAPWRNLVRDAATAIAGPHHASGDARG